MVPQPSPTDVGGKELVTRKNTVSGQTELHQACHYIAPIQVFMKIMDMRERVDHKKGLTFWVYFITTCMSE